MIKPYIIGFGILTILTSIAGGYLYITSLTKKIETQASAIEGLHIANTYNQQFILELQAINIKQQKQQEELHSQFAKTRKQTEYVKKVFSNHDFEKLLKAKPGLVGTRMQSATNKLFVELQKAGTNP